MFSLDNNNRNTKSVAESSHSKFPINFYLNILNENMFYIIWKKKTCPTIVMFIDVRYLKKLITNLEFSKESTKGQYF